MFLDDAVAAAADSANERMKSVSARELERRLEAAGAAPAFKGAIARQGGGVRVIAEVKRRSPSAGAIREDAQVRGIVAEYRRAGAAAVSILTSDLFGGSMEDLEQAREAGGVPVLRKEFISLDYQVLESRAYGASAILLISEALSSGRIAGLLSLARELGLEALVESHGREGLERALEAGAEVIGINNRDLATLEVDTGTTARLLPHVPAGALVVSESGIRTRACVREMEDLGVDALLIGEELMRAGEPGRRLRELLGRAGAGEEADESCG